MLATETGVDQSKAAGLYLHPLLLLPRNCRIIELKQACYCATASKGDTVLFSGFGGETLGRLPVCVPMLVSFRTRTFLAT